MPDTKLDPGVPYKFPRPARNACTVQLSPGSLFVDRASGEEIEVICSVRDDLQDRYNFTAQTGDVVQLSGTATTSGWYDYHAQMRLLLPTNCTLDAYAAAGAVQIQAIDGGLTARTDGGGVSVTSASGAAKATAAGGDVRIDAAKGDVTAETSGGSIRLGAVLGQITARAQGGSIQASLGPAPTAIFVTQGGSVRLAIDRGAGFRLNARASGGQVVIRPPLVPTAINTGSFAGDIGKGGATTVEISAAGGSIVLEPAAVTPTTLGPREVTPQPVVTPHPVITGAEAYDRGAADPPAFNVQPGVGRYWAVEVASDPALFDASRRTPDIAPPLFFATWQRGLMPPQDQAVYRLPAEVWAAMRSGDRIYYRVVTTDAPGSWHVPAASYRPSDDTQPPYVTLQGAL